MRSAMSGWMRVGQAGEHLGGERGVEVGDHQRDRLRGLGAQEADDLLGWGAAQELEGARLVGARKPRQQFLGALGAERALEHFAGELDSADDVAQAVGAGGGGELAEDRLGGVLLDRAELGHFEGEALDLLLAEVLDDLRGALGAERGHQHGGLAAAADAWGQCQPRRGVGCGGS